MPAIGAPVRSRQVMAFTIGAGVAGVAGARHALIGPNGTGKTTLLVTLMGLTRLHGGAIRWRDDDIAALPTYRRAHAGLGWVPQERCVYPSLTVKEHLTAVARPGRWTLERVYGLFPRLEERRHNLGSQLSGGEQQMLTIARALMVNPSMMRLIRNLVAEGGMAVILVEQHARLALSLTRNAIVLDRGHVVHQSDSQSLLRDPDTLNRLVAVS